MRPPHLAATRATATRATATRERFPRRKNGVCLFGRHANGPISQGTTATRHLPTLADANRTNKKAPPVLTNQRRLETSGPVPLLA